MSALAAALVALGLTILPANISAVVSGGKAHINVRFAAAGENVQVAVRGGQGLKVEGDEVPVSGRSVGKGERIVLDIGYQPGPDQSTLTVEVTGTYGGQSMTASQTFKVGVPSDEQRHRTRQRAAPDGQ